LFPLSDALQYEEKLKTHLTQIPCVIDKNNSSIIENKGKTTTTTTTTKTKKKKNKQKNTTLTQSIGTDKEKRREKLSKFE
jgi:hypothetical protein